VKRSLGSLCVSVGILLALSGCSTGEKPAVSAFDALFELEQTTVLSDSVLLGPDAIMDVSPNGDMAVLERSAGVLAIFRKDGSLRWIVEHTSCAPDYPWPPSYLRYSLDQSLLVMSPGQGGIRFDADGQCVEKQSYGFPMFRRMAFTAHGDLRLLSFRDGFVVETRRPDGTVVDELAVRTSFPNLSRYIPTGGLAMTRDETWMMYPWSHGAHLVSPTETRAIGRIPDYFRPIEQDFTGDLDNFGQLMSQVQSRMLTASFAYHLYAVDARTLLIIHRNGYEKDLEFGLQVVDTEGTVLNDGPILLPATANQSPVRAVRDGRIYIISYADSVITDRNPTVLTYRFKGK